MPKRFADRDQAKCSLPDSNLKAGCAQKLWQASSLREGNLLYKNFLAVRLYCKFMICYLERFSVLPGALCRLKRSVFKYLAEVSAQKVLSK